MDKKKVSVIAIVLFLCLGSFVFANSTQSNFEERASSDTLIGDNGGRTDDSYDEDSTDYYDNNKDNTDINSNTNNNGYGDNSIYRGSGNITNVNGGTNNGQSSDPNEEVGSGNGSNSSDGTGGGNGSNSGGGTGGGDGSNSGGGTGGGNGSNSGGGTGGGNGSNSGGGTGGGNDSNSGGGTGGGDGSNSGGGTGGGDGSNSGGETGDNGGDMNDDYSQIIALVDSLQEMINNSTKKSDINSARKYRDNNDIMQKISTISDNTIKTDLQRKLDIINKILNDKKEPIINGIIDGAYVNTSVSLDIYDNENNIKKIILNGSQVLNTNILKNINQEGKYVVEVIDEAFNKKSATFTIDKTPPKVVVATSDFGIGTNKSVTVFVNSNEVLKKVNGWEIDKKGKYIYREFFSNCSSSIVVEDLAGNKAVASYSITSIDPNYEAKMPHATDVNYVSNLDGSVTVTITISKPVYQPNGWTDISGSRVFTKTYYKNVTETVWLEDTLSNIGSVTVVVNSIKSTKIATIQSIYDSIRGAFNLDSVVEAN